MSNEINIQKLTAELISQEIRIDELIEEAKSLGNKIKRFERISEKASKYLKLISSNAMTPKPVNNFLSYNDIYVGEE